MREPEVSAELAAELGGSGTPVRWERLTAPETAEVVQATDAVIIPVGATEQHGQHMALCVDTEVTTHVALGVSALTGVPVVPALQYGVSGSHGGLPGTIALRPETMIALVEDVIDSLYRCGFRQFILLNGHTWNGGALDVSAEKLRTRYDDARVRYLAYVTMYPGSEVDGRVTYGRALMHANFFETSLMLHIDPDAVHMERVVSLTDVDSFWDYRTDQVSRSGVWGREIDQATAEHGAAETARCIETTARAVAAAVAEPWPQPR
ncbi:creatininase family protein [Amycolatopsis thermoflava]|uniref:Creatinine amidohydrolase n=1 Tax=Amycolatopsis thermoflava TaxID=84480 RepID=A0A3N2GQL9_9PSEU|nr:creatininase family protein [Amycolatopsis thermoflava]ROS38904.1 creatinine amidohydrolase [Amycolatopsis thermoflava]